MKKRLFIFILCFVCIFNAVSEESVFFDTIETVSDFIFLVSKITADGDCSHEIKRRLLLGTNTVTNLDIK